MLITLIGKRNSATSHTSCCVFIVSSFFWASLAASYSVIHTEVGFGREIMFQCFDGTLMFLPFVLIATLGCLYQMPAKLLLILKKGGVRAEVWLIGVWLNRDSLDATYSLLSLKLIP